MLPRLSRPLLRASLASRAPLAAPRLQAAASVRPLFSSAPRREAREQAGAPASDSIRQAAKNVKQEASQLRSSIESAVAGGSGGKQDKGAGAHDAHELLSDAKTISGEMFQAVPRPALLWGAAGIIPYVSTAGASIYLARQANLVADGLNSSMDFETASALLLHAQNVQISYGAIILSFLGAIHWGFEFAKYGGAIGNRRFLYGLVPVFLGWPTLAMAPEMALVTQFGTYVITWFIDLKATTAGWAPKWYSSYRFWLTAAVGTSIIATLAGTNYYNSDKSLSSARGSAQKLANLVQSQGAEKLAAAQRSAKGNQSGKMKQEKIGGDLEAEPNTEDGDSFVKIRNPKKEEEERKAKEEEERKAKEEEKQKKAEADEEERQKKQEIAEGKRKKTDA